MKHVFVRCDYCHGARLFPDGNCESCGAPIPDIPRIVYEAMPLNVPAMSEAEINNLCRNAVSVNNTATSRIIGTAIIGTVITGDYTRR